MIKRGLYRDLSIELGSPLEAALVFHEQRENSRAMIVAMAAGFGGVMKDPNKILEEIQEMYMPGTKATKQDRHLSDVAKIKAAHKFDWASALSIPADQLRFLEEKEEMRNDPVLSHYVK